MSTFSARLHAALLALPLLACGGDSPLVPPAATLCGDRQIPVRSLAVGEATVITGNDAACFALAGAGAEYVLAPQVTGSALVWAGYGFRLGAPSTSVAARSTVGEPSLSLPSQEVETLHGYFRRREAALPLGRQRPLSVRMQSDVGASAPAERDFKVLGGLESASAFVTVRASLRYSGSDVLVYMDTAAALSFDAATLSGLGARLDALTAPMRASFGDPTDVDANQRVIFLLTPVVNSLVRASSCSVSGFVRGFFLGEDLTGAPQANDGEIFYGYVPDPTSRWSCAHTAANVLADLPPTYVHELQHLISFGARVVTRAAPSEEIWLNEGLSHFAEELGSLYYESRFPAPSGRAQPSQIFPDSAAPYITPNVLSSYRFLLSSSFYSLAGCAPGSFCSPPERSGVWLFLRWMTDSKGQGFTRQLVQSSRGGRSNIEFAAGESLSALLGDFAVAVVADSIIGRPRAALPSRHRFASRNLRQLYRAAFEAFGLASGIGRPYPIEPLVLAMDGERFGTMRPASFIHYRLSTGGSAATTLAFTADDGQAFVPAAGAQVSVVRVR